MTTQNDKAKLLMQNLHPAIFPGLLDALALIKQGEAKARIWLRGVPSRETCATCKFTGTVRKVGEQDSWQYVPCPDCEGLSRAEVLQLLGIGEMADYVQR